MSENGAPDPQQTVNELLLLTGEQTYSLRKLHDALRDRDQRIAEAQTELAAIKAELAALRPKPEGTAAEPPPA